MVDSNTLLRTSELERLSALETLKGLSQPEQVKLGELVSYLESRDLWRQFAKITLGDLRDTFASKESASGKRGSKRKKRRILEDALQTDSGDAIDLAGHEDSDLGSLTGARGKKAKKAEPQDGGLSTEEVEHMVYPFVEGNGDVTLDDMADYTKLDKKVLRFHINALVKEGKLERVGVGRHAIYSAIG